MTLKEKFKERLYNQSHDDSECLRIRFENIDKVIDSQEQIAEEFAMNFAQWTRDMGYCHHHSYAHSYRELIEMYKKEQNL